MDIAKHNWSLAPLALAAGIIPLLAAHGALLLSVNLGYIDGCNPYIDGCTSISRAGRYGLANHLFKAVMLPYAALLAAYWFACAQWLRTLAERPGAAVRWIPWLGLVSALFLVLYAAFLGTDGDFYRLMRRYGVFVHFGFNFIAQLLLTGRLAALAGHGALPFPRWIVKAKVALCALTLAFGLANVAGGAVLADAYAFQNAMEWSAALLIATFYLATWLAWRSDGFAFTVTRRPQ